MGGEVRIVLTTLTRTPLRWHASTKRREIAVARKDHDVVNMFAHFHHVDGEFDVHIAFDLAATKRVGESLGRLRDHGIAVVIQPIDQRANGGIFFVFDQAV